MEKYSDIILEQNKESKEDDWKLSIDVSKIWNQYDKGQITLEQFNAGYANFLKSNQNIIQEKTQSWKELNDIIIRLEKKKSDEEGSFAVWDDIYDWGDSNLVEIKAENKSDF